MSHLIDDDNSCDVIYSEFFEKMGLNKENLWPYEGSKLHAFNGTTARPWGHIELMITVGKVRDVRTSKSQLLVVPCKSVYDWILGRPFVVALYVVSSPVHIKLKFHNLHGESVMFNVDLVGVKRDLPGIATRSEGGGIQSYGYQCSPTHRSTMGHECLSP